MIAVWHDVSSIAYVNTFSGVIFSRIALRPKLPKTDTQISRKRALMGVDWRLLALHFTRALK